MQQDRWCELLPFSPLSPTQVKSYLYSQGYKLPKNRLTKKETANEEALSGILSKQNPDDPVIPLTLDARGINKGMGYLSGNTLGRDGKYHSFYTFRPDTGRLSAINPNIMNQPNAKSGVDKDIAAAVRGCIIPSPGKVLMEFDWKAMEAVLTGFFAEDEEYTRISKLDSHTYLLSFGLKDKGIISEAANPKWSDADLISMFEELKKKFPLERQVYKTANLSSGYGIKAAHLAVTMRSSVAKAKEFLAAKDVAFPKLVKWRDATMLQAHNEGKLSTPFNYIRHFFEVLKKGKDGKWRPGKEANEALAFRPQSTGSSMLRETLLFCIPFDGELFNLLAPVHDALLVECYPADCNSVVEVIKPFMEKGWDELGGLKIEVDVSIGSSWGEMRHYGS